MVRIRGGLHAEGATRGCEVRCIVFTDGSGSGVCIEREILDFFSSSLCFVNTTPPPGIHLLSELGCFFFPEPVWLMVADGVKECYSTVCDCVVSIQHYKFMRSEYRFQ